MIPLVIGAVAAGIAHGWQQYTDLSDFNTIVAGAALFCVFMALLNYFMLAYQTDQMKKRLAAIFGLEDNLLRRIQEIEIDQDNDALFTALTDRIHILETKAASLQKHKLAEDEALVDISQYDDENVVRLQPNRAFGDRLPDPPAQNRRLNRAAITQSLDERAYSIKMQPVINLMNKQIVAVEAFAFVELKDGLEPVENILRGMSDTQLCQFDLDMITALSKISRQMEEDRQSFPIHFTMVSLAVPRHETWSKIINRLKADTKLASIIVPYLPMAKYERLNDAQIARFMELKEYGFKPGLKDCSGVDAILKIANRKSVIAFKIPVNELLEYTPVQGERRANVLLPKLARLGVEPIATDIEKAHHASNLIDLDISLGQGNFISPARAIKFGKYVEEASQLTNISTDKR
ncbi:MAG: EAL domain-containing protein [Salaquimonas sp.]